MGQVRLAWERIQCLSSVSYPQLASMYLKLKTVSNHIQLQVSSIKFRFFFTQGDFLDIFWEIVISFQNNFLDATPLLCWCCTMDLIHLWGHQVGSNLQHFPSPRSPCTPSASPVWSIAPRSSLSLLSPSLLRPQNLSSLSSAALNPGYGCGNKYGSLGQREPGLMLRS